MLSLLGAVLSLLGAVLDRLGCLEVVLGSSWGSLRLSWDYLGIVLGCLGPFVRCLGRLGAVMKLSWGVSGWSCWSRAGLSRVAWGEDLQLDNGFTFFMLFPII